MIRATDYHAAPLYLDQRELAQLGLQLRRLERSRAAAGKPCGPSLMATLDRMIDLIAAQEDRSRWREDLMNLRKLQVLVEGWEEMEVAVLLGSGG